MCLSTIYKVNSEGSELFAKNIQNVVNDENTGELRFRDIMGIEYVLKGTITNIDLIGNTINVAAD